MAKTALRHRLTLCAMFSAAHAACAVILWTWTLGITGLGFKDKSAWTSFDHLQATVVPTLMLVLTAPGRFAMLGDGWTEFLYIFIANSLLWGAGITLIYVVVRRRPNI